MADPKPKDLFKRDPIKELRDRVEKLEKQEIQVADLPINAIRRALRKEPEDPIQTFMPGSVNAELLHPDLIVASGEELAVWNASAISAVVDIAYDLEYTPKIFMQVYGTEGGTALYTPIVINGSVTEKTAKVLIRANSVVTQTTPFTWFAVKEG